MPLTRSPDKSTEASNRPVTRSQSQSSVSYQGGGQTLWGPADPPLDTVDMEDANTVIKGTQTPPEPLQNETRDFKARSSSPASFKEAAAPTTVRRNLRYVETQAYPLRYNEFPRGEDRPRETQGPYSYAAETLRTPVHVCETVRKWNLQFNGRTDPVAFLERLDELKLSYRISDEQLLTALPELLRESALAWYRNNKDFWLEWDDFKTAFAEFYLPSDYQLRLEEDISRRRQKPGEQGKDYVIELQTMMRRHGLLSGKQQLFRLYTNLLPEYRQYIRWRDISSPKDLVREIEAFERLQMELKATRTVRITTGTAGTPARTPYPKESYNRAAVCWRCGQKGHSRSQCPNEQKLFCSRCGQQGVLSRDCPCPGNARRTGGN